MDRSGKWTARASARIATKRNCSHASNFCHHPGRRRLACRLEILAVVAFLAFPLPIIRHSVAIVPPDLNSWRVHAANSFGSVSTGGNAAALTESLKRLKGLSAAPGEAGHNNRSLNVVVVDNRTGYEAQTPSKEIVLDLHDAGDAGFVVIASGPSVWRVRNAPLGARAKIAFESEAAFDLLDAPTGLLAGFKSGAFGNRGVTTPADYVGQRDPNQFALFCREIESWARFFNTPFQEVKIWSYRQAPVITLGATQITARGQEQQWARSISFECNPPRAVPQTVFPQPYYPRTVYFKGVVRYR